MNESGKITYKKQLHQHAVEIIRQRIADAKLAMDNAQAAANSEEKSSAGDKYETSRAMNQLEKDMHANQFAANQHELSFLLSIDCDKLYDTVSPGSVVVCPGNLFFIASGLGKMSFENKEIYFLSPVAPLAKLFLNKITGDTITFNNKEMLIKDVF